MRLTTDLRAVLERTVGEADTAAAVGSGSLPVLGTPVLLAWCEAATCAALEPALDAGETSVGTRVALEHQRPSAVGAAIELSATVVHVDGRLVRLSVAAREGQRLVASGEVTRVVVDAQKFLARLG
ncbi:Predicted thioesterase [Nocardioides scoriae]|uniref:Predicted thioesterase n=1 Tax=Nocardioides scoriae TaxID=642780 RepID=A0A1H1XV26_9ACTN|nr:hotdog domain-containing protein [Nocardioides scoriae]SDT13012.1 Predicted thioesterase [Nocardioides scoriae]